MEITRLNEQIKFKNDQIKLIEDKIARSDVSSHHKMDEVEQTRVSAIVLGQLLMNGSIWFVFYQTYQ